MTETTVTSRLVTVASDLVPNTPLCDAMRKNLEALGPPAFTAEDRAYAAKMQATLSDDDIASAYRMAGITEGERKPLVNSLVPADAPVFPLPGSTDVGDVSWVVPTVQLWGANYAIGTPFHSWQMVAQGKSDVAIKGMVHAASVIAAIGADLFLDPDLRAAAKADHAARVGKAGYIYPLPEDAEPPIKEMG